MIKIALNNYMAGSGKDAVASYLCENHGFKKYNLAHGIYEIAYTYFGIPRNTRPPRKLLHHIGESLREYDRMIWINDTLKRIELDGHDRVIITDVRKLLEHAYLGDLGWNNVMIYCDPKIALERLKERDSTVDEDTVLNSSLENQLRPLKDYMKVIDNSDSFEETAKELDAYVRFLEESSN